ncbi:MAG TPA: asparagine synthase (glutamine-hydrolyzing) [Vicinamibacterales bacterium]|nr:asparagine synthase (glutamine-hydrolyzing) [Vicinamibacterales bacterium]
MCGIAGIIVHGGALPDLAGGIRRMTATLHHRGPDDRGYHVDERAALGHTRLSIIDVANGHQPIYNEDGTLCVVFNGEIYNFPELRSQLMAAGHAFRTNSDTETIVHAYEEWGEACVERFRGMFAFAIRDRRTDALFLARDRFGKKPLFYSEYAGRFVFASEMKAILADPLFDRRVDEEALAAYFTFGYVPAPLTIFRHIRKLEPGHAMMVAGGHVRRSQYWDLTFRPRDDRTEADVLEELRARLREAVAVRLMSEVPLGAFLSGGIDSSAVVAYMAEASADPVNTFTIGFAGDTGFYEDERRYASMVASRYRTRHREHEVRPELTGLVEQIVRSFDEPFADDSAIPSYFVCKAAREHVTVALSGLGGDEAFCGYERYLGVHLSRSFRRLPRFARAGVIAPLVTLLRESRSGGYRVNHLKRFVRSAVDDEARQYLGFMQRTAPAYRERLFAHAGGVHARAAGAVEDSFLRHYRRANADDPLDRAFYCDVKTYLPDDILALTDRLSMCHSLEVRVPFLDQQLFEFSATIPSAMKLKWFRKKHLLKKALKDVLPPAILNHRKQGFVGPLPRWIRGELKPFTLDVLSPRNLDRHGIFDRDTVARVLADHFASRETNDVLIWALIVFQSWYDLYIEKPAASAVARPA